MMLSGNLSDWSVGDLLQMLHITKKTASLHVDGSDRSGVVHFEDGAIVNAEVSLGGPHNCEPRAEVVEAVYVLELLDEGAFEIRNEVPPRMIEPLAVAEALEMAGQHLDAERHLDETGLLSARGLRLAQTITEPIILSEQVWNAISGSIPAFTFPELEARLGRAGAVSTIEQFRDLGILEAVLDDIEPAVAPTPDPTPLEANGVSYFDAADSQVAGQSPEPWTPPAPEQVEVVAFSGESEGIARHDHEAVLDDEAVVLNEAVAFGDEAVVLGDEAVAFGDEAVVLGDEAVAFGDESVVLGDEAVAFGDEAVAFGDESVAFDDQEIVPEYVEEVSPIVADAPDDSIVVPDAEPVAAQAAPASPGLTPGASSLSAAIRAAAEVSAARGTADDEAMLLSEAAGDPTAEEADTSVEDSTDDGSLRRTVKSLVSPPETTLVTGTLGDLGSRFRRSAVAEQED